MAAQYSVPDPTTPGKMFMNYQGLASYLSSGGEPCTHLHQHLAYIASVHLPNLRLFPTRWQLLGDRHRLWKLRHHVCLPHPEGWWYLRWRLRPHLLQEPPRPASRHSARRPSEAGWNLHDRTVSARPAVWGLLKREDGTGEKVSWGKDERSDRWLENVSTRSPV